MKCADNERRDLLNIKALSTWTVEEEEDCCKWGEVTCNGQTGHVTGLYLADSRLEGEISPSLLNLTHLTLLNLRGNSFNGTIPRWIGSLTELSYLDLSDNSFSGPIPQELGNLSNLQSLLLNDLGKNCTVENINWLSRLSHLESLNMNGISLAKANHWVDAILSLQNLTDLNLERCDLSQVMLPYSYSSHINSSSSNIAHLLLGNNNLNSSMYPWLYPLTRSNRLESLSLSGNKLDEFPKYLGNLCHLTSLDFTNNSAIVPFSDFLKTLSAGCTSDTLEYLGASSSQFTGSISDDIQRFSSLQELHLSHNQLNGTVSEMLWVLPNLTLLNVSSNSLKGAIFGKTGKSRLRDIDLSNNLLQGVLSKTRSMSKLSHVEYLDLSSCKLGPRFPKWIQTFKNQTFLEYLNIANTGISDTIPMDFWDTLPSQLRALNLSSNNISGKAPDFLSNYRSLSLIDLSSNNFYGPIPNVPSNMQILNLSKNKFNRGISFLCEIAEGYLGLLDLSNNKFTGQIPDCLWNFKRLVVLKLGNNHLFGRLPTSIGSMIELEVLYLYNNGFSGDLPLSLRNCTKLTFLDLGANKFSGNIPVWIGESLLGLYVLSLGSNNFTGPIPLQFCQLVNLQILDLSMNNLNGIIPLCVNNFTAMVQKGFLSTHNVHQYENPLFLFRGIPNVDTVDYVDRAMIQWQGNVREFSSNIGLLRSIDLSSNNLTGKIPIELTDLTEMLALNLSNNAFFGQIPQKIGHMKELEILDLSSNNISGALPATMSQINFLNYLDVSYNNLSGRIPWSTQLQSFGPSRYIGNAGLCGPPLTKNCAGDEEVPVPSTVGENKGAGEGIDEVEEWFYIGGATGFAIGFGTVCTALLLSSHGRLTFFHFMDSLGDWVNLKVNVVFRAISKGRK